ncbi:MAG: penicillin-binding protein 2 [Proteobacteria bacterium]|nr:penicillin-binding protein 2 [Pseudomonadota bacterium]MDA1031084.1 penicillin-binding protein 2 [Pseudomonadota bacterium]
MTSKSQSLLKIRLPVWRARLLVTLMFMGFMALAARALYCQSVNKDFLQAEAEKRYARTTKLIATRGLITDRNGEALAISTAVETVTANPSQINLESIAPEKLIKLSELLDVKLDYIKRRLIQKKTFVYLKRQISPNVAKEVMALKVPGISLQTEYKRYYPNGEATAHLVGFTSRDQKGQEGLEYSYQNTLAGKSGSRRINKNAKNQIIEEVGTISAAENGTELLLSIDRNLQYVAFSEAKNAAIEHEAKSASVVVLDTLTGEILALANWPSYNPNNRSSFTPKLLRNLAIIDQFEPGSTLKPFTVAAALEGKFVKPNTLIDIEDGRFRIGHRTINDTHPQESLLTVTDIIQRSSNVGTAKISLMMKPKDLWEVLSHSGFGQLPTSRFPGEVRGSLRSADNWKTIEQATISYGHGVSVSLLQLARAYTIFAREGMLVPVTFEKRMQKVEGSRVISSTTSRSVLAMLETVTQEGGTGTKAAIPGYRVAGKTGTAHKLVGGQYARDKYRSSFVGLAPVSSPRLIVAVVVDEPSGGKHYGGDVAAPVFRKVMEEALTTLGIDPDDFVIEQEAKRQILQGPV